MPAFACIYMCPPWKPIGDLSVSQVQERSDLTIVLPQEFTCDSAVDQDDILVNIAGQIDVPVQSLWRRLSHRGTTSWMEVEYCEFCRFYKGIASEVINTAKTGRTASQARLGKH